MVDRCSHMLVVWLVFVVHATAQDRSPSAIDRCRQNLTVVFDALQAYESRHKAFPDRLEQLVPAYLKDPSYLVCPLALREGDNLKNREHLSEIGTFDSYSSYDYELSSQTRNKALVALKKSPREYKLKQRALVGDMVPIVRCLRHPGQGHRLNLSFDRRVYVSGDYWEVVVRHLLPHVQLMPEWVFSSRLPLRPRLLPRQDQVPAHLLDLSSRYNCHLADGWLSWDLEVTNTLAQFPAGIFMHGSLSFDARGLIQLEGDRFSQPAFPDGITNLAVQLPLRRLHLLHGTEGEEELGKTVAFLVVRGPESVIARFPIRYGIEVAHWWADPGSAARGLENAQVAWEGDNPAATSAGKRLRLFVSTFEVPQGPRQVTGIDILSAHSGSAPFLLAITSE